MNTVLWKRYTKRRVFEVSVGTALVFGVELGRDGEVVVSFGPFEFWTRRA